MEKSSTLSHGAAEFAQLLGHPAGIIPSCIGAEDGVGYILLGKQKPWPLITPERNRGWCCFWGAADKADIDIEATAAREAAEESNQSFGSAEFLREILRDVAAREMIFRGGFLISLGALTAAERLYVRQLQAKRLARTINPAKREMSEVGWFRAADVRLAVETWTAEGDQGAKAHVRGMGRDNEDYLRGFFLWDLTQVNWDKGGLKRLLAGNEPFPDARDRYGEWKRRAWQPTADGKEKEEKKE